MASSSTPSFDRDMKWRKKREHCAVSLPLQLLFQRFITYPHEEQSVTIKYYSGTVSDRNQNLFAPLT